MRLSTESLAVVSARHPWRIVAIWLLVLLVAGTLAATLLKSAVTPQDSFIVAPESEVAEDLLESRLRGPITITEILVVRSASATVDDAAFAERVNALTEGIVGLGREVVLGAVNYYKIGDEGMVSADRHTTLIAIVMAGDLIEVVENVQAVRELAEPGDGGFETYLVGNGSINRDFADLAEADLLTGEIFGVGIAMVILVLVFRAAGAAVIPVVLAIVSITIAIGLASLVGQVYRLSFFIVNMITMIGLAVGIDYSLFIVGRYREERAGGLNKAEAIARAGATSTRAVFFSGVTVVLALVGMLLVPASLFFNLGMGAILVAITAVIAALTLLPAILSLMGDRVEALKLGFLGSGSAGGGPFWNWITRIVMAHRLLTAWSCRRACCWRRPARC